MDKISIITTFYNAQTFIGNAIGSVLGQKVPDGCEIEYVLVDDKSQDNSRKLVENIINNTSKENFEFWLSVDIFFGAFSCAGACAKC